MGSGKEACRILCWTLFRQRDAKIHPPQSESTKRCIEIVSLIKSHLEENPRVCLFMAHQGFYAQYFPYSLSRQWRVNTLLGTGQTEYYCNDCSNGHSISDQDYWFLAHFLTCNDFYGAYLSPQHLRTLYFDYCLSVPFQLARKVMDAHRSGSPHDYPAELLVPRWPLKSSCRNVNYVKSWNARIVDDQLALYSQTILTLDGTRKPAEYVDMGLLSICRHVNTGRLMLSNQDSPSEDAFSRLHGTILSCPICLTDYYINILWQRGKWKLGVYAYHILNTSRLPADWSWDTMAYCPEEARASPRIRKMSNIPPGRAVRLWDTAQGMAPDMRPDGEWAPQPESHKDTRYMNRLVYLH
ncbi:hypothetical protein TrVFT333_007004 [Trichoderma virens FT-333]|nr:hypothetical protein TrVFT333_007004 [Trichoderma virens FT-333]